MAILTFGSCDEDDKTNVSLIFKLEYGGEPLVMFQDYAYPDGKTIQFTRFSFYLSDLTYRSSEDVQEIEPVDFVNLTSSHTDLSSSMEGFQYRTDKVDVSKIEEISFNMGLTESQNQSVPADYASGHPLARPGEYWVAWDSYIFAKIEGWIDLDNDGEAETGIALHLGSNEVMQEINLPVSTTGGTIDIIFDLKSAFEGDQIYDIEANPQLHSLSQLPAATELARNLSNSIYTTTE